MGRSIPIQIGTISFPSRKAAEQAVRDIWDAYEYEAKVTDDAHHEFLFEIVLMHQHPASKIGPGIEYFKVVDPAKSGEWRRSGLKGIWIVQVDGTEVEFSPINALRPRPTPFQLLTAALVNEAQEITGGVRERAFDAGSVECPITRRVMTNRNDAETRRLNPPLQTLVELFLRQNGLSVDQVEVLNLQEPEVLASGRPISGRRIADPVIRERWLTFQQEHTDGLAVVHREAARRWTPPLVGLGAGDQDPR